MADDNNAEDPAERSGELIRGGEPPVPARARTGKEGTINWLLSRLSRWPFRNKAFARSLETAQDVVEKQTTLEETIIQHGRTRGRLNDLEITLAQDRLQRRREFVEERSRLSGALNESMLEGEMMDPKNKLRMEDIKRQQKEQRIQRMEQEKRELLLAKELEALKKPPPPPAAATPAAEKMKLREDAYKRFDKEVKRIEAMKKATPERKTDLKKAARSDLEKDLERIDRIP